MSKEISRRRMLAGAALGVAGAATVGLAGCAGSGSGSDAPSASSENWDYEADLVVIGCGSAGISAAAEGMSLGMSVIALDKYPYGVAGGSSRCNGGLLLPTSDEGKLVDTFGKMPDDWRQMIVAESAKSIEMILDGGVETMEYVGMTFAMGNGPAVYEYLDNLLLESGAETLYDTRATRLIQDTETGEVRGVLATQGEAVVKIKAAKGVVVATGGYTGSEDLMESIHYNGIKIYNTGAPSSEGDGLKMALQAGANLWYMNDSLELDGMVSVKASEEMGIGIKMSIPAGAPSAIYLNKNGMRFTDETLNLTHYKGCPPVLDYVGVFGAYAGADGYLNLPAYQIFDQKCFDAGGVGNNVDLAGWALFGTDGEKQYVWSEDNSVELEKGWIVKGDTLEDLAGQLGLDPSAVSASVADFNAACAAGVDPLGRQITEANALGEGPYYGVEIGVGTMYSISGPEFNMNAQVLDFNGEVIPRLYVAGDVSQGVGLLPITLSGCMAYGRIAATHAATLDAWTA